MNVFACKPLLGKAARVQAILVVAAGLLIYGKTAFADNLKTAPSGEAIAGKFVMRSGPDLILDGKPFRFSGVNIYWLGQDRIAGKMVYSTEFRVNDALDTAREMGENVVRIETFAESTGNPLSIEPALGQFNEDSFKIRDYVLKAAADRGIRLIIPLVDNWTYSQGGKHNFTDWRGITDSKHDIDPGDPKARAFYTDPQVIEDFKAYVSHVLNHVNQYTGRAYKDDPAILCWETGDELSYCPGEWTQVIADYIRGIDPEHLIMDGKNIGDGFDYYPWKKMENIDIESPHYHTDLLEPAMKIFAREKKVVIIGEFKWNGQINLGKYLEMIENDPRISGDLYWDLMPHADDHGYVQHDDNLTLHYPGDTPDMRQRVALLRTHAYKMRGLPEPAPVCSGEPLVTEVKSQGGDRLVAFRGTAAADRYTIERSTAGASGPWTIVADHSVTDLNTPWLDKSAPAGPIWYRVKSFNLAGVAGSYSPPFKAE